MKKSNHSDIVVSGVGVTSSIGQGKSTFTRSLLNGEHRFDIMKRPGRQNEKLGTQYLGAEIAVLQVPDAISKTLLRTASLSAQVALSTVFEAWHDANLDDVDRQRIGLIVGGSNVQQRELVLAQEKFRDRAQFLRPTYGISFMDSDICGLCTESLGIKGFAYTIGGASASGQVAVLQAINAVESGQVDVCIAVGSLMDLSYWECQGFRSLGAMGSDKFADDPARACRPFDNDRNGFIFGESCGAIVIEKSNTAQRIGVKLYARLGGWGMCVDGNRNPNPSFEGEVNVIQQSLKRARLQAKDIDYINPHGTGSTIGDETELKAFYSCGLNEAHINATKSIIGHGLTAAGAVEIVAVLMQMKERRLHPTRNLDNPMNDSFNWVKSKSMSHSIKNALSLSMGFGGVNTALCLQSI